MIRRYLMVVATAVLVLLLPLTAVAKEPASVVAASDTIELTENDNGDRSGSVTLTNLTDQPITLAAPTFRSCTVGVSETMTLKAAVSTTITLTFGPGCPREEAFDVSLNAASGDRLVRLTAAPAPPAPEPDWTLLYWFGWVAGVTFLVLLGMAWWAWQSRYGQSLVGLLPLKKEWSFTDSFASKITLGAGVLVAFVGSADVLDAVLGDAAESTVSLLTVTAAISAGLVGAAPLMLVIFGRDAQNSLLGVLLAALFTVTGTGGQLAVLTSIGGGLDLGGAETTVLVVGVLSGATLLAYTVMAIRTIITQSVDVARDQREAELAARVPRFAPRATIL